MAKRIEIDPEGYQIELEGNRILSIQGLDGFTMKVGDGVVFNGRYGPPAGTVGRVVKIDWPYRGGLTGDVLAIETSRGVVYGVKIKDLDMTKLTRTKVIAH